MGDVSVEEASAALLDAMAEAEPEREEQEFDAYTATLEECNARDMCGHVISGGRRCVRKIVTWFGDPEDEAARVGACGTHAKEVEAEIKHNAGSVQSRQIEKYLNTQMDRVVNILNNAGLKARRENTYRTNGGIIITNWGVLLAWLDGKGLDFDERSIEEVAAARAAEAAAKICPQCKLEHVPLQEEGVYYPACDQYRPHVFFPMKNNKDKCAICEGPQMVLMHDADMLGKS